MGVQNLHYSNGSAFINSSDKETIAIIDATSNSSNSTMCEINKLAFLEEKLYLVAISGSALAMLGIFENLLLTYIFLSREKFRSSNMLFFAFVAFFDFTVDLSYILIFPVSILYEYYANEFLMNAWYWYICEVSTMSHICITASTFLIVCGSFERYRTTRHWTFHGFNGYQRVIIICCAILLACLAKGSKYWEITVLNYPYCENVLARYALDASDLAMNEVYRYAVGYAIRNTACVLLPFVLLLYFNLCIIQQLSKTDTKRKFSSALKIREAFLTLTYGEESVQKHRSQVRNATRTLVLIACTYIVAHFLNVIVKTWEMIDHESLIIDYQTFYWYATEIISQFTVIANIVRLPIYCLSDLEIRKEVKSAFCAMKNFPAIGKIDNEERIDILNASAETHPLTTAVEMNGMNGATNGDCDEVYPKQLSAVSSGLVAKSPVSAKTSLVLLEQKRALLKTTNDRKHAKHSTARRLSKFYY